MMETGKIFAIKKYAIHDGPAIRTTVFFKGCPLRCAWCHNPEGLSGSIELVWMKDRCAGCGQCLEHCPNSALCLDQGEMIRDKAGCDGCGHCADICPALAHEAVGRQVGSGEVMDEIRKDIIFYDQSGGGVTFSGGDPLMQPKFLLELLVACKDMGIHRAVDTCAHTKTGLLPEIADHTDLFLIDIKHMDSDIHRRFTGVSNGKILENIKLIAAMKKKIRFRIPLIDGVNSGAYNIEATGAFIARTAPGSRVDLLPYHGMAGSKYTKLGITRDHRDLDRSFTPPDADCLHRCTEQLESLGLRVSIGG